MSNSEKEQRLLDAAREGDLIEVRQLIENEETDINAGSDKAVTALYLAVANKHKDVAQYLMQSLEAVKEAIKLSIVFYNDLPALKQLVTKQNINLKEPKTDNTLLHMAVIRDRYEIVRFLVENGADVFALRNNINASENGRKDKETPAELAKAMGYDHIWNYLHDCEEKARHGGRDLMNEAQQLPSYQKGMQLVKNWQSTSDNLRKTQIGTELCDVMNTMPYEKAVFFYKQICSHTDKDLRTQMEMVIRNIRERE